MDPELLVSNLKVRLGDLSQRKRKLNRIIVPPKIAAGLIAGVLVEYLAWLLYDGKNSGLPLFIGFYGLLLGVGGALALVDLIAGWFGFPKKEYEALDPQISRIGQDIYKVGRFIMIINEIKQLQSAATPSQNVTLNGHIETLKKATEETVIPSYDSYTYESIRRSVGAIRGHIKRNSQAEAKGPSAEKSGGKTAIPNLPIEKTPSPSRVTPSAHAQASKDESIPRVNSIPPISKQPKPETPSVAKQLPEMPKVPPQAAPPTMADILRSNRQQKPDTVDTKNPAPSSAELDISTVFNPRPASIVKKIARIRRLRPTIKGMVNYLEVYIKNRDIGQQGEQFVLNFEREYLLKNNRKDLADQVAHVSLDNDALGYDILSFDLTGAKKHIEVKTTNAGYESQFFLSVNETLVMEVLPNYYIYRVYNFDRKGQKGSIYKINCAKDFDKYFRLETAVYKVIPNVG